MNTLEILQLLCGLLTAVIGAGGLKMWTDNKKYIQEVEKLKTDVQLAKANTRSNELDNVKKAMGILMDEVVEPLKLEINAIRKELSKFRRAVEKANSCRLAVDCPVRRELQYSEKREQQRSRDSPGECSDSDTDSGVP